MTTRNNRVSILRWLCGYFLVMVLYTLLDMVVWRRLFGSYSEYVNVLTIALLSWMYVKNMEQAGILRLNCSRLTIKLLFISMITALLLYVVLDMGVDPFVAQWFPNSEASYQLVLETIAKHPLPYFIQVVIIAPIVEEIMMRGFLLTTLKTRFRGAVAIMTSAGVFALFHFSIAQGISAFIAGIILGYVYDKTDSIVCVMGAHALYNLLSFIVIFIK